MWPRTVAPLALLVAVATAMVLSIPADAGYGNCGHRGACTPSPTSSPTSIRSASPSITASPSPTSTATSVPTSSPYTFDEEFSGSLAAWGTLPWLCCGTLAGYDPSLAVVSGGLLHLSVVNRASGWWGDLLDSHFSQRYGHFEARMQVPEGAGLWPAFWLYSTGIAEIDAAEVCANPLGTNGGNDASLLHQTLHYGTSSQLGFATRTADLSTAFHVYGVDWRADRLSFYLDGALTGTTTDLAAIPTGALPLIVNLGIGGSWCGAAGAPGTLLVDWIRATT